MIKKLLISSIFIPSMIICMEGSLNTDLTRLTNSPDETSPSLLQRVSYRFGTPSQIGCLQPNAQQGYRQPTLMETLNFDETLETEETFVYNRIAKDKLLKNTSLCTKLVPFIVMASVIASASIYRKFHPEMY